MSPLWRDEIGIFLAPHKLALTRMSRGVRPRSAGEVAWANDILEDTHWAAPLTALDGLLAKREWQGAVARIVVSDQWVRYAIVPYSAALSGEEERLTHARHVLTGIYGVVVSHWSVTLSDSRPGSPQVACALPANLLEELQLLLARHRVPLRSLQPQLVSAYNHWRSSCPTAAWFRVLEPPRASAGRMAVHSVRVARTGPWSCRLQTFGFSRQHHGAGGSRHHWGRGADRGRHERRGPGLARRESRAIPPRASLNSCAAPAARFFRQTLTRPTVGVAVAVLGTLCLMGVWRSSMPGQSARRLECAARRLPRRDGARRAPIRSPG